MQKVPKLLSRISLFLQSKDSLAAAEAVNYKESLRCPFWETMKVF